MFLSYMPWEVQLSVQILQMVQHNEIQTSIFKHQFWLLSVIVRMTFVWNCPYGSSVCVLLCHFMTI